MLYELHCKKDSLPYIGKTSKTAEDRFVGHLNTILQDCHSNTKTHSHTDIQVTPPFVRKAYENIDFYWGKVLQSTKNKKVELNIIVYTTDIPYKRVGIDCTRSYLPM